MDNAQTQVMTTGSTASLWMELSPLKETVPLKTDLDMDVCIIGAGISGLTAAYLLCKAGKKVALLEDGYIGGGQTARTTAHVTNVLDDRYYELESLFGEEGSKLAAESHRAAITFIDDLSKREGIDCHFEYVNSYLFNPPGESNDILEKELAAVRRAGMTHVKMVERAPIKDFDTGPALEFTKQGSFLPLRYIEGLANLIEKYGGKIFTRTHADFIEAKETRYLVTTKEGKKVLCDDLIVATNSPVNSRFFPHLKQAAYRTYVIGGLIPKGKVVNALYYDTPDPYHYVRIAPHDNESDYLIVGGEDHRTGEYPHEDPNTAYEKLEEWTKERFPFYSYSEFRWSGQIMEPIDSLAFIGKGVGDHVYIATGDSGNGITHGTIAGMLLSDLILQIPNPWAKLYDPHRKTLKAWQEFSEENLNTLAQYRDWLSPGEVEKAEEIKPGCGAIIRTKLRKMAVYRDEENQLHYLSAVCPHLQGLVRWNQVEKTWDCPCHGSCFAKDGTVIQGPALHNLEPIEDSEKIKL